MNITFNATPCWDMIQHWARCFSTQNANNVPSSHEIKQFKDITEDGKGISPLMQRENWQSGEVMRGLCPFLILYDTHGILGLILYMGMAKGEEPRALSRTILIKIIRLQHKANYTQRKKEDVKTVKTSTHRSENVGTVFVVACWALKHSP